MQALDKAIVTYIQSGLSSFIGTPAVWMGGAPETAVFPFILVSRGAAQRTTRLFGGKRLEYIPYLVTILSNSAETSSSLEDDIFTLLDNQTLNVDNGGVPVCWIQRMPSRMENVRDASGNAIYRNMLRLMCLAQQIDA